MTRRHALRVATATGLLLAWAGLPLPWRRWSADAAEGSVTGFAESRPFWIALAVVTVVTAVALRSRHRWPAVVLAGGALVLIAIGARPIGAALADAAAFVSVGPGAGAMLSLAGALVLLAAALVELAPIGIRMAAALAVGLAAAAMAAIWPRDDARPAEGAIADAFDDGARALAFHDGTLYALAGGLVTARPAPGRSYDAVGVLDVDWTGEVPVSSGISPLGLAFSGDELYVSLGGIDRLASISADGDRRLLVARPPDRERDEPPIPAGQDPQVVDEFRAGPIEAAPGGGVYLLRSGRVDLWRAGRLTTVAGGFDRPSDIAIDARGRVYVADTGNGRVRRIDPDGTVVTVVGTEAARRCVRRGLDDPLARDVRRCTGVRALALDAGGNLYLALRGVATVVGVTPEGRMAVVAGAGPKGWGDGGGRAVGARLGDVAALAAGPDGDLYVGESWPLERVRRVADPAGILHAPPPRPQVAAAQPGCAEIAALTQAVLGAQQASRRQEIGAAVAALDRRIRALEAAAPDAIRHEVRETAATFRDRAGALAEASFVLADVGWNRRVDLYLGGFEMEPDAFGESIGDYAEGRCGLVAGHDVGVDEVNAFCVAYQRFVDRAGLLPAPGEEPPRAYAGVVRAAPPVLAPTARAARDGLASMAGRSPPRSEVELVAARAEAVDAFASSACAID